jgi:hypothetical protein
MMGSLSPLKNRNQAWPIHTHATFGSILLCSLTMFVAPLAHVTTFPPDPPMTMILAFGFITNTAYYLHFLLL